MVDEIVGTTSFNIGELARNVWEKKTFVFNDVSVIYIISMVDESVVESKTFEPRPEISNNLTFDKCRLRRAYAASF